VLVGTTSIEKSELLSGLLKKEKMPHQVLNAKQHAREAEIVAQAGRPGMVTIATNMAGRGTDIVLGGNIEKPTPRSATTSARPRAERRPHRRAARPNGRRCTTRCSPPAACTSSAPNATSRAASTTSCAAAPAARATRARARFYLSLEDPLLKIFAGERLNAIMVRLKMPEGEAIEHPLVTRSLESAQRKVEQRNFDIRKQLLEYDDVANDQRKVIYQQRNELLESEDIAETITRHAPGRADPRHLPPLRAGRQRRGAVGLSALEQALLAECQLKLPVAEWIKAEPSLDDDDILERVLQAGEAAYAAKTAMSIRPPGTSSSAT
jgi:preprotein translocase subunit SecA